MLIQGRLSRWCFQPVTMGFGDPVALSGWVSKVGGVAQLGEHLLCKQGVTGSIPVVSTSWNPPLPGKLGPYRGNFEFGASVRRGMASPVGKHAVAVAALAVMLVFVSVNQVLVRLWARASRDRSSDWPEAPAVRSYV